MQLHRNHKNLARKKRFICNFLVLYIFSGHSTMVFRGLYTSANAQPFTHRGPIVFCWAS